MTMTMLTKKSLLARSRAVSAALAIAVAGACASASAQDVDPTEMVRAGFQAIAMVDQNRVGELWDGATPAAKRRMGRNEFMNQLARARAPLGVPQQRAWAGINRQIVNDPDADVAGQYLTIEYDSRFANAAKRELLSFHLERDGVWRFSGYVIR